MAENGRFENTFPGLLLDRRGPGIRERRKYCYEIQARKYRWKYYSYSRGTRNLSLPRSLWLLLSSLSRSPLSRTHSHTHAHVQSFSLTLVVSPALLRFARRVATVLRGGRFIRKSCARDRHSRGYKARTRDPCRIDVT